MIQGRQHDDIHHHADEEIGSERLLLRFMAKDLLSQNRPGPAAH